mgnify:CR=1 FL=1|jgi:hypothetical protein
MVAITSLGILLRPPLIALNYPIISILALALSFAPCGSYVVITSIDIVPSYHMVWV